MQSTDWSNLTNYGLYDVPYMMAYFMNMTRVIRPCIDLASSMSLHGNHAIYRCSSQRLALFPVAWQKL